MFYSSGCVGSAVVYSAPESLIILVSMPPHPSIMTVPTINSLFEGIHCLHLKIMYFPHFPFLWVFRQRLQIKVDNFKGTKPTFCFLCFTLKLFLFLTHCNLKTAHKFNNNLLWHKWNWMYLYKQSMFIHPLNLRKIKEISTTSGTF